MFLHYPPNFTSMMSLMRTVYGKTLRWILNYGALIDSELATCDASSIDDLCDDCVGCSSNGEEE
jgi:hypothetical protein